MKRFQPKPPTFNLLSRAIVIAVLAVTGLITSATAQNAPHGLKTPPQKPLNLHPGNGSSAQAPGGGINPDYGIGWNYVNATNCDTYFDNSGNIYVVVYPWQGGYFYTSYAPLQNGLISACQNGNWIAIYIYDDNYDWDQLYTYDYN
jgi:hypothetical protein